LPDAVAASRSRRSRPSARSGHERSRGPRSRTAQKDALATGSAHPRGDTPARPPPSLPQASAGRYRSDLASLPGVLCSASVGAVPKRAPRWCCTALGKSDPSLMIRSSRPDCGRGSATRPYGEAAPVHPRPAPPGAGRRAPSCVRDQARQGRNGVAGSSEAEERRPAGRRQTALSASTAEPVLLPQGGHPTEHCRMAGVGRFRLLRHRAKARMDSAILVRELCRVYRAPAPCATTARRPLERSSRVAGRAGSRRDPRPCRAKESGGTDDPTS